jgi:hypothetical protein
MGGGAGAFSGAVRSPPLGATFGAISLWAYVALAGNGGAAIAPANTCRVLTVPTSSLQEPNAKTATTVNPTPRSSVNRCRSINRSSQFLRSVVQSQRIKT